MQELSEKLNIKQSSLLSWKSRNSINVIKNKYRDLGIYNEIFGSLNTDIQLINTISDEQNAQNVHGNQIQIEKYINL